MNIARSLMASSTIALSLLGASPALASPNETENKGLHLGSFVQSMHTREGIKKDKKERRTSEVTVMHGAMLSAIGAAGAGVVTSVSGSTFLLNSFGTQGTTTVTTNAGTVYKVNGVATTSSALSAGSRVIVFGTGSSTTGITASLVSIVSAGTMKFFNHFSR